MSEIVMRKSVFENGIIPQKSEWLASLLILRCPRVCHKMSSRPVAVGVISFSSWPIRTSHSDCVLIDRTIITPMQI